MSISNVTKVTVLVIEMNFIVKVFGLRIEFRTKRARCRKDLVFFAPNCFFQLAIFIYLDIGGRSLM